VVEQINVSCVTNILEKVAISYLHKDSKNVANPPFLIHIIDFHPLWEDPEAEHHEINFMSNLMEETFF